MTDNIAPVISAVKVKADALAAKFANEWGWVRRMLASHPLTTAWMFFAAGVGSEFVLGLLGMMPKL